MAERHVHGVPVLVVGGAGFLGSHLVEHLIEDRACTVYVWDNMKSGRMNFIHLEAEFFQCDPVNITVARIRRFLRENEIQYVFNYAAEPYVPDSYRQPTHTFMANVILPCKLLEASEGVVKGFLQVGSAEVYGRATGKVKEDDITEPHSTYAVTKLAVEQLCRMRWVEAKLPVIVARQFNCVGERETHPYVVPEIITQLSVQSPPYGRVKLGNNTKRDFLYAGDAVRMAVELLEKGEFGEVYNIGSEETHHVYDIAKRIGKLMGFEEVEVIPDESRKRIWEVWHLHADCQKLYSVISYRPKVSLDEALERTITWFRTQGNLWPWQMTESE